MNADFQTKLNKLIEATGGKVRINSGYRSPERQAQLYADAVRKYGPEKARHYVAPPGHSKHNEGIAADLGFADAATKAKAHQLAAQFGLSFPMSWEPWHIEPMGSRK
jgi:LAS superfamily LD-carboxypeptidase LdcB